MAGLQLGHGMEAPWRLGDAERPSQLGWLGRGQNQTKASQNHRLEGLFLGFTIQLLEIGYPILNTPICVSYIYTHIYCSYLGLLKVISNLITWGIYGAL